jgi:exodeoxyribonuclease VII small subunit
MDTQQMSFEEALKQLEDLVKQFEDGNMTLDQAIAAYEQGNALKNHCFAALKKAQSKIEQLTLNADQRSTE